MPEDNLPAAVASPPPCEEPPAHIVHFAIRASMESPCQSKRGVAIYNGDDLVSVGFNHQPKPFYCDGSDGCKKSCGRTAIHAEQMAILNAGNAARGARILHVKSAGGILIPSDGPSCLACSKLVLFTGLAGMWLFHCAGWKFYEAALFHYQSGKAGDYMVVEILQGTLASVPPQAEKEPK